MFYPRQKELNLKQDITEKQTAFSAAETSSEQAGGDRNAEINALLM